MPPEKPNRNGTSRRLSRRSPNGSTCHSSDNKIEIPDARIHYEPDQGSQAAFSDIEVVTAAYRPQHLRAKEQAGFRTYASSSDRAALSAKIEDEHHTLDWVLDL